MSEQLIIRNVFLVAIAAIAMAYDLRTRRIPNRLVICGMLGGLSLNAIAGTDAAIDGALGLMLATGIGFVPFALGWLGAGDVKFLGAIGAIVGVGLIPRVMLFTAFIGAVLALVSLVSGPRRGFKAFREEALADLKTLVLTQGRLLPEGVRAREFRGATTIPYGIPIGVGALVAAYAHAATSLPGL